MLSKDMNLQSVGCDRFNTDVNAPLSTSFDQEASNSAKEAPYLKGERWRDAYGLTSQPSPGVRGRGTQRGARHKGLILTLMG